MLDVIVVGAGPAGAVAAATLARRGCQVLVLDRARFPRPKPCGDYLNPGCAAVLGRTGALRAVFAAAVPVAGVRIMAPDGTGATTTFSAGMGYALPRSILDHLLVEHAAGTGASVLEETSVAAVDPEDRCVRITAERERGRPRRERYCARMVIGADGLRSMVARAIGLGEPPRRGRFTVGGYLDGLAPPADTDARGRCEIHLDRDRYCGAAYLPNGLANVTIALERRDLRAWRGRLEACYWTSLRAFHGLTGRISQAALVGGLRTSGPLAFWRRRAGAGRVLLAGDAAAFIDPMTGQGVYLALRGGELAAEAAAGALEGAGPTPRTLAAYERARRRAFGTAFVLARIVQGFARSPALVGRAVRRMAVRPDLGTRFIDAIGNVEGTASVFRPRFVAGLLGLVDH